MNKIIARCIFTVAIGVWIVLFTAAPWTISDKNEFLKHFVGGDLLNVLGVILAITLASAANLHLEFNNIENIVKTTFLSRTRSAVKKSAFSLIILFVIAVTVVVVKPLVISNENSEAFMNGAALLIVIFNMLVLTDLTFLVFSIEPLHKMVGKSDPAPKK